jgi:septal ring factor EnvC (AmiA/AmiB activator)
LPLILESVTSERRSISNLDAYESDFHRWPRSGYERPVNYVKSSQPGLLPSQFQLRHAEIQIELLEDEVMSLRGASTQSDTIRNENEFRIKELQNELSASSEDLVSLSEAVDDLREKIQRKNQRIEDLVSQLSAIRLSKSYRSANFLAKLFLPLKRNKK